MALDTRIHATVRDSMVETRAVEDKAAILAVEFGAVALRGSEINTRKGTTNKGRVDRPERTQAIPRHGFCTKNRFLPGFLLIQKKDFPGT